MTRFITVTNADEKPVRRYGRTIEPGEHVPVPDEEILAYSSMEIALTLQVIARKLSSIEARDAERFHLEMNDRLQGRVPRFVVEQKRAWKLSWRNRLFIARARVRRVLHRLFETPKTITQNFTIHVDNPETLTDLVRETRGTYW
jgi:hypothetical protein